MCNIYQNHIHFLFSYGFSPMFLKVEKNKQTKKTRYRQDILKIKILIKKSTKNKQKRKLYKHEKLKKNKEKI